MLKQQHRCTLVSPALSLGDLGSHQEWISSAPKILLRSRPFLVDLQFPYFAVGIAIQDLLINRSWLNDGSDSFVAETGEGLAETISTILDHGIASEDQ